MFSLNDDKKSSIFSQLAPKTSFILGLIAGVLVMFVVGFFVLLGYVLKNQDTSGIANNNQVQAQPGQPNNGEEPTGPVNLRPVQKNEVVRGGKNAKVVMVEFSDYECPFCARHHETMLQIMNQYKDQVAWVFRHFPLDSIHPQARPAALAAECANEQDKFWEYSDAIYKDQDKLSGGISFLQQVAKQLKLNESKFNDCLSSAKYQSKVDADYQEGIANGVSGTPGTFIAGQLIKGAVPFESFKQIIDQALNAN
ncbi:MAG: hypothetical protein COX77_02415 [Candidatus Komeilibacteria bacterium CG_4_10_14_0_2_um_filter_37_10]|uniref:Thioredoxin domain-containing protein n=1 Tax=Candidatus Komeilibacteria bacterium CG_4_10_14_0_2_um_filter_37_10 TaxID=1974470 RepID=A0A2M7VF69_9BACT|nr:MAG: hypothetical protein COX77_02415 [Candidatus Komeilibacteria bacterium CG_4_10_14_0_2_um_filter_37_10]